MELKGEVLRILFSKNNFCIGVLLETEWKEQVTFKGPFKLDEGDTVVLEGEYEQHKEYGRQFVGTSFSYYTDLSKEGLIKYISRNKTIKGIGIVKASKLINKYGNDFENNLRHKTEEMAEYINIPVDILIRLRTDWFEKRELALVRVFLVNHDIPLNTANKLIDTYGSSIINILKNKPYSLINTIPRFGFKTVDSIALKLGIEKTDPERIKADIMYLLEQNELKGHSWISKEDLINNCNLDLILDTLDSKEIILDVINDLVYNNIIKELFDDKISNLMVYNNESSLAEYFRGVTGSYFSDLIQDNYPEGLHKLVETENPYKHLNEGQRESFLNCFKYNQYVISGQAGSGKAQPLDSRILTKNGWKKMGDLVVGENIVDPDGGYGVVENIYPQGFKKVYKVTFSDGSVTECCNEHLWLTATEKEKAKLTNSIKSLEDIRKRLTGRNNRFDQYIPMVSPVEMEEQALPLHPYLLGLLLGNGHFGLHQVKFSSNDKELIEKIQLLLPDNHYIVNREGSDYDIINTKRETKLKYNCVLDISRNLGLSGCKSESKFIPDVYLNNSLSNRLAIFHGLMDTDGYCEKCTVEYTTVSKKLMEGVKELVNSFGGKVTVTIKKEPVYYYKGKRKIGQLCYRLFISLPPTINPFSIKRKLDKYIPRTKYKPARAMVSIDYVGEKECQCIKVNTSRNLYVTDDYIVTHNTFLTNSIVKLCEKVGIDYILCATTGKAAKRLQESTQREACTLHRLLGYIGTGYTYIPGNINNKIIIVDEVGMATAELLYHLYEAVDLRRCCIIMVGDHNQLPPVGVGNVLKDILHKNLIPNTILKHCVRQSGELKENCVKILEGKVERTSDNYIGTTQLRPWYKIDKLKDKEELVKFLEFLYTKHLPDVLGLNLITDIQLLTPINKGPLGTIELNKLVQKLIQKKIFNREVLRDGFYKGDKVIHIRNNYDKNVMNGEMGIVIHAEGYTKVIVQYEEKVVEYENDDIYDLRLAYVCTIHKMQGNETPIIILLIHKSHTYQHSKNLVYTGVTRSQRSTMLIGDAWSMNTAVKKVAADDRRTILALLA